MIEDFDVQKTRTRRIAMGLPETTPEPVTPLPLPSEETRRLAAETKFDRHATTRRIAMELVLHTQQGTESGPRTPPPDLIQLPPIETPLPAPRPGRIDWKLLGSILLLAVGLVVLALGLARQARSAAEFNKHPSNSSRTDLARPQPGK
jgi:hypothetical protein